MGKLIRHPPESTGRRMSGLGGKKEGAGGQNSPAPVLGVGRTSFSHEQSTILSKNRQRRIGNKPVTFAKSAGWLGTADPHFALFSPPAVV
jgi:hypothetical protein